MSNEGNSRREKLRAILWKTSTVVWAALIFDLSMGGYGPSSSASLLRQVLDFLHLGLSPAGFETVHYMLRKLAHPVEYAVLAMLIYGSSPDARRMAWRPRRALWCLLIAAVYSLTDEFHQRFVPGRSPALADCGIDTLGGVLGLLTFYARNRRFQLSTGTSSFPRTAPSGIAWWINSKLGLAPCGVATQAHVITLSCSETQSCPQDSETAAQLTAAKSSPPANHMK